MSTKIAGGFDLGEGIVLGPLYQGKNADRVGALLGPPIWAFNFGIGTILNNLDKTTNDNLDHAELQHIFNSTLDNLIAEILIYLENRLKVVSIKNELDYRINSIIGAIKAYGGTINFDLTSVEEIPFLKEVDVVRGEKHHTNQRYSSNCQIGAENYDSLERIKELVKLIRQKVESVEKQLDSLYPIFTVVKTKKEGSLLVEWTSLNHAFDAVSGIIIKKDLAEKTLNKKHITYWGIEVKGKFS